MSSPTVLVTGASGQVGRSLAQQLLRRDVVLRLGSREPTRLRVRGAESVTLDFGRPDTVAAAVAGVDLVFLLWPFFEAADDARAKAAPVMEALGSQVRRVVYLSSETVERSSETLWGAVEEAVERHVAEWTMLRPTGFAGNARQWAPQIRAGDVVRWPLGEVARPLIHEADMAAVAAEALLGDDLLGRRVVITGPERISQREQVATIGTAIGRNLRWQELDRAEATRDLDLPGPILDAWQEFLARPEPVTDEVSRILARPATGFAAWARGHVDLFYP